MKRTMIATVLVLASASSFSEDAVKEGMPCLSGVCAWDDITSLTHVTWEAPKNPFINKPIISLKYSDKDIAKVADMLAPQSKAVVAAATPYIQDGSFDADGIAKLTKVAGFCEAGSFTGRFKSESGHLTRVIAHVVPTADGSAQTIRVTTIIREYPRELTRDQVRELRAQLQQRYASLKEAYLGDTKQATWSFRDVDRQLWLFAPFDMVRNRDLMRKYPGCSKSAKID